MRARWWHRPGGSLAVALCLASVVAPADGQPRRRCGDGHFLIDGGIPVRLASGGSLATLVLQGRTVAIEPPCAPVRHRLRRTSDNTVLRARWAACAGVTGPVRVGAALGLDCDAMGGVIRVPGEAATVPFKAQRSGCGDGIVDPGLGEECEPPGTAGCDSYCRGEP